MLFQQEKCSAINAFAECLETATSGSPSPSSDALLAAALSANGGCVKPSVKPSLHAQGGSLTANVDAAGDFCIERPGMIPACVGNLVQTVTELSDDVTTQLASADAKTSAALTAAAAALEVQTIQIGENVDTSLAAMENKLDATSTTLDAKIDVTDAKITAFGATYGQATTDKLAALDTKLTARIVALEKGAQCNFRGTHDGTKCVCIKGYGLFFVWFWFLHEGRPSHLIILRSVLLLPLVAKKMHALTRCCRRLFVVSVYLTCLAVPI